MATTFWNDERLNALSTEVQGNASAITELRMTAEALLQVATIHQGDIEGLRVEIRRLIEELRQQRN